MYTVITSVEAQASALGDGRLQLQAYEFSHDLSINTSLSCQTCQDHTLLDMLTVEKRFPLLSVQSLCTM
jgi:hypothetical protein